MSFGAHAFRATLLPPTIAASEIPLQRGCLGRRRAATFRIEIACDLSENKSVSVGHEKAFASASSELSDALARFPQIKSSNSRFTDWMNRSTLRS